MALSRTRTALGHWLLDDAHDDLGRVTSSRPTSARRSVESAASDFAGLLLVPEAIVAARWDLSAPEIGDVSAIATACGVSGPVAALGVLRMTDAPRAVALAVGGLAREWWAETAAFGARVRSGRAVPEGSAAARQHDARPLGAATVATESWDARALAGSAVRVVGDDVVMSWLRAP